jgi:catechol-2,3-dioxygenase
MIGKLKTVVFDAADIEALATFYDGLAGWTTHYSDEEWATLMSPDGWRIGLQIAPDHVPPKWPDPERPQQAHFDLRVRDLDAAVARAQSLGATRLGGGETWVTLADPAGHPFDLCASDDATDMSIFAITIDAPDAKALGAFYSELLGLPVVYEGDEGALLGSEGDQQVMFQQVQTEFRAPRWPDPAYPQQFHLDVMVDDIDVAEKQALAIGATRLPGEGGNWRVYADPAGHPFCLLYPSSE